jgi:predicted nucleotidyltransferase
MKGTLVPDMSTKATVEDPAAGLFPKTRRAVLALLYGHPGERFYLRRIVNETGLAIGQVQRELQVLSGAGVISRREEEGRVYFQADEQCPIHQELRGIVRKTMGAAAAIHESLRPLERRIRAAFVFGSTARGEETAASDVDLMVVGDVSFAGAAEAVRKAEQRIGREVNLVVYPGEELKAKAQAGHHFVLEVLRGEKIFLIGGEGELGAVLEEPVDS